MCQALEKANRKALPTSRLETLSSTPYKHIRNWFFKQVIMDSSSHTDGMGNGGKPPSWNVRLPLGCPLGVGTGLMFGCRRKIFF